MKKKIITSVIILLIVAVIGFITTLGINYYVKLDAKDKIILVKETKNKDVDCILVLGAGIKADGTPSPMLEDRLEIAIEIYKLRPDLPILVSGDNGSEDYNEIRAMKEYLLEKGISETAIFADYAGFSTYDSLYRLKHVFKIEKVFIVTQKYHLYRAIHLANKLGIKSYGISASLEDYKGQPYYDFREYLARNKDFIKAIIKPKPTYLGEEVPVLDIFRSDNS